MDGIFLSRGNRGFPRKELRLDCAQAFHALHEKLTLARREVFFRSAEPPDKMDLHFILRLRAQNSARLFAWESVGYGQRCAETFGDCAEAGESLAIAEKIENFLFSGHKYS